MKRTYILAAAIMLLLIGSTLGRGSFAHGIQPPNACLLLQKSDLERAFPAMRVEQTGNNLSPIFRGPQYTESCLYAVELPDPNGTGSVRKFLTITIIRWGHRGTDTEVAKGFRQMLAEKEKIAAANPDLMMRVERIGELGDEAFQVLTPDTISALIHKDDLIFGISLDRYSEQTLPFALKLAAIASSRWDEAVGYVDVGASFSSEPVAVPQGTRVSATSPGHEWPDACVLLTEKDVLSTFPEARLAEARQMGGVIRHEGREARDEKLPKPMGCWYTLRTTKQINGKRQIITNQAQLTIENVSTDVDLAKKMYAVSQKIGESPRRLQEIGDEAVIDLMNKVTLRKGRIILRIRVSGGERDQALHDEAARKVIEIAKKVAAKI